MILQEQNSFVIVAWLGWQLLKIVTGLALFLGSIGAVTLLAYVTVTT